MEDYKKRMIEEYQYVKDKQSKLYDLLVKYDSGTLGHELGCPVALLREQARTMQEYLRILELRAEIEGVGLTVLRTKL